MARSRSPQLDAPLGRGTSRQRSTSRDRFGRFTEWVARAMGTPAFLLILTLFCVLWICWNTLLPDHLRFDDAALGFTALTLMLSLQASYAAPLILLAQNRQDDRDRVQIEQDRQRAERNLADTEYLAREIVALRMSLEERNNQVVTRDVLRMSLEERNNQVVTRDVLRQELKALLAELGENDEAPAADRRSGGRSAS